MQIIRLLDAVKSRPSLYLSEVTPSCADSFIIGFHAAYQLLAPEPLEFGAARSRAAEARGWRTTILGQEMRKRGLSDAECVSEMLAVEIDAWSELMSKK